MWIVGDEMTMADLCFAQKVFLNTLFLVRGVIFARGLVAGV